MRPLSQSFQRLTLLRLANNHWYLTKNKIINLQEKMESADYRQKLTIVLKPFIVFFIHYDARIKSVMMCISMRPQSRSCALDY